VPNATTGVNAVLRSLAFESGDELLVTSHTYAACRKTVDFVASRTGAKVVVANLPFPCRDEQEIIEAVLQCVSPRTRLALLDHVTSPTALILPIARLVGDLQRGESTRWWTALMRRAWYRWLCRAGRCLLHRQCAQMAVRSEGRRLPARAPRPAGAPCIQRSSAMATARDFTPNSTGPGPAIPRPGCAFPRPAIHGRSAARGLAAGDGHQSRAGPAGPRTAARITERPRALPRGDDWIHGVDSLAGCGAGVPRRRAR
jgi:hypothetical protein